MEICNDIRDVTRVINIPYHLGFQVLDDRCLRVDLIAGLCDDTSCGCSLAHGLELDLYVWISTQEHIEVLFGTRGLL
jgi:hypothetical protein